MSRNKGVSVRFGDVVTEVTKHEKAPLENGLERYVGLEHLDPLNLQIKRWGNIREGTTFTKRFEPGHLLFGKRRCYQKKAAVAEFPGVCSGDIIVMEPKNGELLPELLPFLVQSDAFFAWAEMTSSGSLSPRTKFKALADFQFPLPPKERQREILEILQALEESLRATEDAIESAEQLKRSLLSLQLCIQGVSVRLREISTKITDGTHSSFNLDPNGEVQFLQVSCVKSNEIIWTNAKQISLETYAEISKGKETDEHSILYTVVGSYGCAAVVGRNAQFGFQRNIALIQPNLSRVRPEYLCEYLNSPLGRYHADSIAKGNAQKLITLGELKKFPIRLPSLKNQDLAVEALKRLNKQSSLLRQKSGYMQKLKSTLLSKLLG